MYLPWALLVVAVYAVQDNAPQKGSASFDSNGPIQRSLENNLRNADLLLKELTLRSLETPEFALENLVPAESMRSKRCRWKLCGTGRRFRYY